MKTPTVIFAAAMLPALATADGFRLAGQAAEAVGKGNAFVATANTAAAVYYNAAGLTQLDGSAVQVGFYNIVLGIDADVAGGNFSVDKELQTAPQIYAHHRLNDKWVLGFGLNSPFGLATDWEDSTSFRTSATSSEVIYATFWSVAAYEVTDTLSVAGGIGINHADVTLNRGIAAPGDEFSFSGDDQALSWTVSLRWQPSEKHAFGLVYRSKTEFTLEGKAEAKPYTPAESGKVDFVTPATFAIGYSYRPNKCWNIEANIEWADWSQFDTLVLRQETSGNVAIPFGWQDALVYSVGAEYDMGNGYQLRFGYNLIESAQPDKNFTPGVADADRHWLTLGVGHKGETWSWDAAYQYGFSDRSVGGSADPTVQGDYKSRFHSLSISARYTF